MSADAIAIATSSCASVPVKTASGHVVVGEDGDPGRIQLQASLLGHIRLRASRFGETGRTAHQSVAEGRLPGRRREEAGKGPKPTGVWCLPEMTSASRCGDACVTSCSRFAVRRLPFLTPVAFRVATS